MITCTNTNIPSPTLFCCIILLKNKSSFANTQRKRSYKDMHARDEDPEVPSLFLYHIVNFICQKVEKLFLQRTLLLLICHQIERKNKKPLN